MNNRSIHNLSKKLFTGLFACALLGGFGYVHQAQVHADNGNMDLQSNEEQANQDVSQLQEEIIKFILTIKMVLVINNLKLMLRTQII